MTEQKRYIYDLDFDTLSDTLAAMGQARFRTKQVWQWLYQHLVTDFSQMTNLSKALRGSLEETFTLYQPAVLAQQTSLDGETRKDLLEFEDHETVEVVLMRYIDRRSACISSQIGCAVGCEFCATGQMGMTRNLSSGEIVAQALHLARELQVNDNRLTNIVFMGMGEPFLNYDNVLSAARRLIHPDGFGMGQRRITISTAGVVPGIKRFAQEGLQINLAISLHASTDALRNQLMPINKRYNLNTLFDAVDFYIQETNRRVTFEYVLIDGVNDTPEQAAGLSSLLHGRLAHINFIQLNPTLGYAGRPSTSANIEAFVAELDHFNIPYSLRLRRGGDINAGCGQLRAQKAQ